LEERSDLRFKAFQFYPCDPQAGPLSKGSDCPAVQRQNYFRKKIMSAAMIAILLSLWLIGIVTSYTFGGFLHLLFLLALIVFAISVIRDRRVAA
jgi:hypothetical protein